MPWKPCGFNDSVLDVGGGKHAPEGEYLLEVVKVEPSPENSDREWPFFQFHLKAIKGNPAGVGAVLRYTTTLNSEPDSRKQFALGRIMLAIGFSEDGVRKSIIGKTFKTYAEFQTFASALSQKLSGQKIGGLVADSSRANTQGVPFSEIIEVYPAADWPARYEAFGGVQRNDKTVIEAATKVLSGGGIL